jgi:membrane carboxypeptidase/penicillin-binding protein PbpC
MVGVSGVDGAGPIWHDLMRLAHPQPPRPFARPEGLVEVEICAPSGLLPTPDCPRVRRELFIAGTQPTQPDTQFRRVALDRATGLPADATTPTARRVERVYWLLPPEYHEWMLAQGIPIAPPAVQAIAQQALQPAPQQSSQFAGNNSAAASVYAEEQSRAPLRLIQPDAFTVYQLHPGLPTASQRLHVEGIVANGVRWAELRLVVDGITIAVAPNAARLSAWWEMAAGEHRFWIEGEPDAGSVTMRSEAAPVRVDEFTSGQVTLESD